MPETICGQLILAPGPGASMALIACYNAAKQQLIADCAACGTSETCKAAARAAYIARIELCNEQHGGDNASENSGDSQGMGADGAGDCGCGSGG